MKKYIVTYYNPHGQCQNIIYLKAKSYGNAAAILFRYLNKCFHHNYKDMTDNEAKEYVGECDSDICISEFREPKFETEEELLS